MERGSTKNVDLSKQPSLLNLSSPPNDTKFSDWLIMCNEIDAARQKREERKAESQNHYTHARVSLTDLKQSMGFGSDYGSDPLLAESGNVIHEMVASVIEKYRCQRGVPLENNIKAQLMNSSSMRKLCSPHTDYMFGKQVRIDPEIVAEKAMLIAKNFLEYYPLARFRPPIYEQTVLIPLENEDDVSMGFLVVRLDCLMQLNGRGGKRYACNFKSGDQFYPAKLAEIELGVQEFALKAIDRSKAQTEYFWRGKQRLSRRILVSKYPLGKIDLPKLPNGCLIFPHGIQTEEQGYPDRGKRLRQKILDAADEKLRAEWKN